MSISQPIARLRIQAAQLHTGEAWHTITYSSRWRLVRCSCGGGVIDMPETGEYDGGGCSHIVALYGGQLTEDTSVVVRSGEVLDDFLLRPNDTRPWLAQISRLGHELFDWRWAMKKLVSSSPKDPSR